MISFSFAKAQEHILASQYKMYPVMIWLLPSFSYYTGGSLKYHLCAMTIAFLETRVVELVYV